jgi:UDP-hydrolysing UDP-N-acetyl-D-glucosamine 2-epimerase
LRLAVLTTGRQDWGALRALCLRLREHPAFELALWVGGMHLSARFGDTVRLVEEDGLAAAERLHWLSDGSDVPSAAAQAAEALRLVAGAIERRRPDALLVMGDRFETLAAGLAATLAAVPIVHLSGGEETEGAFDNQLRHALTKLSHLHLVGNEDSAARVRALGEDPTTVHVVGDPLLDNLHRPDLAGRRELEAFVSGPLAAPLVVVTLHPCTLGADPAAEARAVAAALDAVPATYVVTRPNADPGHERITAVWEAAGRKPRRYHVEALGDRRYWGLLRLADAMLGNSSSGIVEAPAIGLPAVNVGDRQKGRLRGANVVDVPPEAGPVAAALRSALDPRFRDSLRGLPSPYGDGHSTERIVGVLERWAPPCPPRKRFVPGGGP